MRSLPAFALLLTAVLAFPVASIAADTSVVIPDQVEEDWVLVVETPDVDAIGPQITTTMSPNLDDSRFFVAFDLNYREYPSFHPGGMQIQVWDGEDVLATSTQGTELFSTPGETVTWTQRLSLNSDGSIRYQVKYGQSTTWGQFGQADGVLDVSFNTNLGSLVGYSPDYSASHSAASWESNHVTSLTLVRVRYYASGRLIATDTTPRMVVSPASP